MGSEKKVGRPKLTEDKKDAMRRRLIACAKEAFVTEGYQSVSIRKITKAACCDPMSFYQYFDSKHALLRALWADYFIEVFENCQAAARLYNSPLQAVCAFLKSYAGYWFEHKERYRLVFMIEDRLVDDNDSFYVDSEMIGRQFETLTDLLKEAVKRGELSVVDPKMTTQLLTVAISGLLHTHITISEYPWLAFDEMLEQLLNTLLPSL